MELKVADLTRLKATAPWFGTPAGPWGELASDASGGTWPAAGARVTLDPPASNVQTAEGVGADVDVSVECSVAEWQADVASLVADRGSITAACKVKESQGCPLFYCIGANYSINRDNNT